MSPTPSQPAPGPSTEDGAATDAATLGASDTIPAIPTHLPRGFHPGGVVVQLYTGDGDLLLQRLVSDPDHLRHAVQALIDHEDALGVRLVMATYDGDTGDLLVLSARPPAPDAEPAGPAAQAAAHAYRIGGGPR